MKPKMEPPREKSLSNSERQKYRTCPRAWFWDYARRYSPLTTPTPFLVGTAVHAAIRAFYEAGDTTEEAMETIVNGVFDPAIKGEGTAFLSPEQLEDLEKQRTMALGMCIAYPKIYKGDLKKWRILKVEEKGSWLVNQDWRMFFTVDLLVEKDDGVWIVEHKTASAIDANYVGRLALDEQVSTYMVGVRKAWDVKPKGVIYNVLLKPRIRQKQTEERSDYLKRVLSLYTESAAEYLYREALLCSKRDLDEFERDLDLTTRELDRAEKEGYYPKNTRACDQRGTCKFMSLCVEGEEAAKDRFRIRAERSQYSEEEEA